jgi:hypothetical protein
VGVSSCESFRDPEPSLTVSLPVPARRFTADTTHSQGAFYLLDISIVPSQTLVVQVVDSAAFSLTGKPSLPSNELQVLNCEYSSVRFPSTPTDSHAPDAFGPLPLGGPRDSADFLSEPLTVLCFAVGVIARKQFWATWPWTRSHRLSPLAKQSKG